jgi:predicted outer membrane repeat protein
MPKLGRPGAGRAGVYLLAAALAGGIPLHAQIYTVTSLADSGPGTLRDQILATQTVFGATINFAVSGTINLASTLAIPFGHRNGLKIDGAGQQITVDGGGNVRVFQVPGPLDMTIANLTIANGKAQTGGGLSNSGFLTLKNVTFRNNTATFGGGAIVSFDEVVTVDSCTFEGNTADLASGSGGAILVTAASDLHIVNSTFTNNHAFQGGAIVNDSGHDLILDNTTIAGNTAQRGGGLFLGANSFASSSHLKNLIVSNNDGGNCAAAIPSPKWVDEGGNIVFPDNTCPGLVADPKLGPLADNGGPTQTMALLAGSPAIDHVVDCTGLSGQALTTDQRGFPRPQGSACDSGAYEASLLAMAFKGFFAPIANLPEVNNENAGRAIPITFSVGEFSGMDLFAAGYPASRPVSCATGQPTGPLGLIDTPGNSGLSFDPVEKRYTIVWKTSKTWGGQCRELVVRLTDLVDHTALFRFR